MKEFFEILGYINSNIVYVNIIIIIFIVFFQKREPLTIFLWILVLIFIPIAGLFFYAFLGQQLRKERKFQVKELEETFTKYIHRGNKQDILDQVISDNSTSRFNDIIKYNYNILRSTYTQNNRINIITDGNDKFDELIKDISRAKYYIFIQYYIIKNDEVFDKIKHLLIKKSRSGIKVCLIYDGMGCRLMKRSIWKELSENGVEVVSFFPPIFGKIHIRANYRNHRKIVVIDGTVAYIGGFNIGKEYIGKDKKFGKWRDTHLRIMGEAVNSIERLFILDWNYAVKDKSKILKYDRNIFYPEINDKLGMQIISSGPDTTDPIIRNNFLKMIYLAKKNIKIQSPYFIPDETIIAALRVAIYSGVKVEIILPSKSDHFLVLHAGHYFAGQLIELGAKIYQYTDGFMHSKVIIVDDTIVSVGSANMDIRSFVLNFEINAMIYDKKTAEQFSQIFEDDKKSSTLMNVEFFNKRSFYKRFLERLSRLFSPIM